MDNRNRPSPRLQHDALAWSHDQYPTTPSTFPQPVLPALSSPRERDDGEQSRNRTLQPPCSSAFAPTQLSAQTSPNLDPTLLHQFSHQNLGADAGSFPHGFRRHVPTERPGTGHSPAPDVLRLNIRMATSIPPAGFAQAPERNPDAYGPIASHNQKKCTQLATNFFKDSVKQARERIQRQSDMERKLNDPNESTSRRQHTWSSVGRKEGQYLRFLRTRDRPENYQTIKVIGKGAFGEVKLVQKKTDGQVYALKSLVKTEMLEKDQLAHVRAERDVLAEAESPWIVKLYTTFQDARFLYMLMEFLPGGDLMTMLIKYEIFSEDITRFYMAECILAIETVHSLGFIHRDIKPDNILLDRGGHIKLTDFGLSTGFHRLHDNSYYQQLLHGKANKPRDRNSIALDQINLTVSNRSQINEWRRSRRLIAYSAVGTPDYIAPEIFTGQGYSFSCDWWSLGTIMFECLVGWPPFCAEDRHDTYRKIVNWSQALYFPEDVQLSPQAENLIRSLVCNPENRLGRGGSHEIKAHPFFHGVHFDQLRRIKAPFEPRLTSNIDTAYFPTDEIDQTENVHLVADVSQAPPDETLQMSLPFIGYTFKRFDNNFR
ncbi:uncharacterized protein E0L32_004945 [Thyridium curvatum]|uniref:non-specific serine/threonine protein kinase n=1 Tax=Thyridium curvatum TaxID=1093900 RepID=A0A507B6U2_9PEZI|nr:uncharacterized protein E0L32_004945 [Thyridium curvatum]TPX14836.1 hypothetical protein E0L32_004945 [Thyridium curvatum]